MSATVKRKTSTPKKAASIKLPASARIVSGQIHGFKSKALEVTSGQLIEVIRLGLPMQELEALQASLKMPMDNLAPKLGISIATLHRRKQQGRLQPEESDRVLRFARLMGKAVAVFGNEKDAREWLSSPQFGLGGAIPLDYAQTEVGAREVENLLGRIDYGVYS
jgi:putative toxin-antitoxin system antitoxin component (TIGR02293 family)